MSSLPPGGYIIRPSSDPPIGADTINHCAVKDVVTDGETILWFLEEVDGLYQLVLDDKWYASNKGDKVVVESEGVYPGTLWKLIAKDELYIIKSTENDTVWTATGTETRSPVVLRPFRDQDRYQLWRFAGAIV